MKRFIFACLLLCIAATSFCQIDTTQIKTKQYYITKSRHEKTTAWILLGSGSALSLVSLSLAATDAADNLSRHSSSTAKGSGTVGVIALLSAVASIPLFIEASHNKRKALALSVNMQNAPALFQAGQLHTNLQPNITLNIALSK